MMGFVAQAPRAPSNELPNDEASLRGYADRMGKLYDQDPGEKAVSISYARALRALTRYKEAVAGHGSRGGESADGFRSARRLWQGVDRCRRISASQGRAHTRLSRRTSGLDDPFVQGAVEDYLGDDERARGFYRDALKIAPGEPSVLNNLGLSYALSKQLDLAENALRQAAASPRADTRVRQNLALVLALDGNFAEAERVSRQDMPKQAAVANMASIRMMVARNDGGRTFPPANTKNPVKNRALASDDEPILDATEQAAAK